MQGGRAGGLTGYSKGRILKSCKKFPLNPLQYFRVVIYFKYIKIQRGRKFPLTIREMQNGLQRNVDVERD